MFIDADGSVVFADLAADLLPLLFALDPDVAPKNPIDVDVAEER